MLIWGGMKVFMCMVDYEVELGSAAGGASVYSSLEDLVENRPCVFDCGVMEVEITKVRVVPAEEYNAS